MKKHISRKRRLDDRLDNTDTTDRANEPRREQGEDRVDEESTPSRTSASPSRNPNTVSASIAQQGYPPSAASNDPPIQGLLEGSSAAASSLTAEQALRIQTLKAILLQQEQQQIVSGQFARQRLWPTSAFTPSLTLPPSLAGAPAASQSPVTREQALTAESLLDLLSQQGDPRRRQGTTLNTSAAGLAGVGMFPYGHQGRYPYGFDVPVGSSSILSEISRLNAAAGLAAGSTSRRSSIPPTATAAAAAGGGIPQLNLPNHPSLLGQHNWLADPAALSSVLGAAGIRSLGDRNTAAAGQPDELSRITGERQDNAGASSDSRHTTTQVASDREAIYSTANQLSLLSQQSSRFSDQQKEEWLKSMTRPLRNKAIGKSDPSGALLQMEQSKEDDPSPDAESLSSSLKKKEQQKEVQEDAPSPAVSAGSKKKSHDDDLYAQIGMVGPWSMSSAGLLGDMMLSKEDIADTTTKKGGQRKRTKKSSKPKRPLSAYNIFFKEERTRIMASVSSAIASIGEEDDDTTGSSHQREQSAGDEISQSDDPRARTRTRSTSRSATDDDKGEEVRDQQDPSSTTQPDDGPKVASKGGGSIGSGAAKDAPQEGGSSDANPVLDRKPNFRELAKTIGERWHALPNDQLERYKALAAEDMSRYRNEMSVYESTSAARSAPFSDTFLENPPESP